MHPDHAAKHQALMGLLHFARGGMAKDMRARHGKPMPEDDEQQEHEQPGMPGVEAVEGDDAGKYAAEEALEHAETGQDVNGGGHGGLVPDSPGHASKHSPEVLKKLSEMLKAKHAK